MSTAASSQQPSSTATVRTPTANRPPPVLLDPTPPNIDQITTIIAEAFADAPIAITFISELDHLTPDSPHSHITPSRRKDHFLAGITRVAHAGAILTQSGTWSAVSIWEPPTFVGADFASNRAEWGPQSRAWTRRMKQCRARYLGVPRQRDPAVVDAITETTELELRPFWHLSFLARNTDPAVPVVPGAVSSVVFPYLQKARDEKVPAWLEATTPYAVAIYVSWGFRVVEEITFGQGQYGEDGWPREGGEGVTAWCLIYDGHLQE